MSLVIQAACIPRQIRHSPLIDDKKTRGSTCLGLWLSGCFGLMEGGTLLRMLQGRLNIEGEHAGAHARYRDFPGTYPCHTQNRALWSHIENSLHMSYSQTPKGGSYRGLYKGVV